MRTKDQLYIGWIDGGQVEGAWSADISTLCLGRTSRVAGLLRVMSVDQVAHVTLRP